MSIAYLTTCFPTPVETFVRREVRDLRSAGLPVECVISLRRGLPPEAEDGPVLVPGSHWATIRAAVTAGLRHPIRLLRTAVLAVRLDWRTPFDLRPGRSSVLKSLALLPVLIALDRRLPAQVRHVHAHFAGVATTAACLLAAWRGCSFSFTAHGSDIFVYPPSDLAARLERGRRCVTVSEYNRRHLLETCGQRYADRIDVVRCGIRTSDFAGPPRPSRSGPPVLLTVARLDPVKGLDTFLRALGAHRRAGGPELRYDLLGDGPSRGDLEALAASENLSDWVFFHGLATPAEVRAALAKADLFVLPSLSEGFPVVLMEAAAARLPLLASRITGIPEILRDGTNGRFLIPRDLAQQQQALQELALDDWAELDRLQAGAATLDLSEFDAATTSKRLGDILWSMIR